MWTVPAPCGVASNLYIVNDLRVSNSKNPKGSGYVATDVVSATMSYVHISIIIPVLTQIDTQLNTVSLPAYSETPLMATNHDDFSKQTFNFQWQKCRWLCKEPESAKHQTPAPERVLEQAPTFRIGRIHQEALDTPIHSNTCLPILFPPPYPTRSIPIYVVPQFQMKSSLVTWFPSFISIFLSFSLSFV